MNQTKERVYAALNLRIQRFLDKAPFALRARGIFGKFKHMINSRTFVEWRRDNDNNL